MERVSQVLPMKDRLLGLVESTLIVREAERLRCHVLPFDYPHVPAAAELSGPAIHVDLYSRQLREIAVLDRSRQRSVSS